MGRPSGVDTLVMAGGAYVRDAVSFEACRGVITTTRTVPTPRGATQVRDIDVTRELFTKAQGASPTRTATGQGAAEPSATHSQQGAARCRHGAGCSYGGNNRGSIS
jgi:hypothetical protein